MQQVYGSGGSPTGAPAGLAEVRAGVQDLAGRLADLRAALGGGRADDARRIADWAADAAAALAKKLG